MYEQVASPLIIILGTRLQVFSRRLPFSSMPKFKVAAASPYWDLISRQLPCGNEVLATSPRDGVPLSGRLLQLYRGNYHPCGFFNRQFP